MTLEVMINISNFNKNSAFGIILYLIEKKPPNEPERSRILVCRSAVV